MITNVSVHRRAHAFAQALEEQVLQDTAAEDEAGSPAHQSERSEAARLLAVADGLGELPRPELDPEVKIVQRAQLIAAMEAAFAEGEAPPPGERVPRQRAARGAHRAAKSIGRLRPKSRLTKGLAAGGLTVGVAAGAFSGVAAASSDALPGDSLYGLKRGMEDLKLGMADDESDRGRLYLDQASTRMQEARRLMERGRAGELDHESLGEVRRALSGVQHDATEGHRLLSEAYKRDGALGPMQALDSFATAHRDGWSQLRESLPLQLTDVGDQVNSVFTAIDDEVGPLRSLLPTVPGNASGRGGTPAAPGTGAASSQRGDHRPTPGHGSGSGKQDGKPHQPRPSSSPSQKEGLLGGTTGGLLEPPAEATTPPPPAGKGQESKPAQPDVTIPPLLPDLLPGLGIDGEDSSR